MSRFYSRSEIEELNEECKNYRFYAFDDAEKRAEYLEDLFRRVDEFEKNFDIDLVDWSEWTEEEIDKAAESCDMDLLLDIKYITQLAYPM